jgi:DNA-binding HxlR family transcriptional regulator
MECDLLYISHLLGKKWAIPVLNDIRLGRFSGFNEFVHTTKITPRTLSLQLKQLEEAKLIVKKEERYSVTSKGTQLCAIVDSLKQWTMEWGNIPHTCTETSCIECGHFIPK